MALITNRINKTKVIFGLETRKPFAVAYSTLVYNGGVDKKNEERSKL